MKPYYQRAFRPHLFREFTIWHLPTYSYLLITIDQVNNPNQCYEITTSLSKVRKNIVCAYYSVFVIEKCSLKL